LSNDTCAPTATINIVRQQTNNQPKVKVFLDTIGRNSLKTKRIYETALVHFQEYLNEKYDYKHSLESIVNEILSNNIDLYELIDGFLAYGITKTKRGEEAVKLTPQTIRTYLIGIKSYLAYYDIDIIPSKFKRKVKVPKIHREDEEPLDLSDIRSILLSCNNRRLKSYLLVLASGGMRATEGLAIRLKDIDFAVSPTKIHIRKEYSKTRVARDIYISNEATHYLNQWIDWKYRKKRYNPRTPSPDDLVFALIQSNESPIFDGIYIVIIKEFQKVLSTVGFDERKEGMKRRKITLHSFRRFVKTVVSDQTNQDYSEWFLGHNKSPYYTKKEPERREIYATKCMKYLTFLDYKTLEASGKNIETRLSEKEKEIQLLRQRDSMNTDAISSLSDQMTRMMQEIEILKKQK
jgi:integrase